jgi:uncharacterized protein (TIGR00369 family)
MRTDELIQLVPFAGHLGMEVTDASPEEVRGRLAWAEHLCTAAGILHGGALMAFADTLGAVCASMNLPEGARTSTIESKTNFFRPLTSGAAEAVTKPLHVGRNTIVVQTDVLNPDGKRLAQVTQTQAVIRDA